MATISARTNDKVFSVQKWYGLNEHPDGDTRLKMGEASTMVNWRITRDGNLKLRPGQEFVFGLGPSYEAVMDSAIKIIGQFTASDILIIYNGISDSSNPEVRSVKAKSYWIPTHGRSVPAFWKTRRQAVRF